VAASRGMISVAVTGVVVAGAGFASVGTANAATTSETVTAYSSDDAYTSSTRKSVNFGQADKLVVGREDGETRLSYVKFTPKLAAGVTVTGAELRLPVESKPVAATLSVHSVAGNWSEKTITAANAPALGSVLTSIKPKITDTSLSFDVSKLVTKAGTYAFALSSSSTTAVTRLRSLEYGDAVTGGPELRLTVTRKATTTPPSTTPPTTTPPTTVPTTPPTTVPPVTTPPTTVPPTTTPPTTTPPTTIPPTTTPPTTTPPAQGCVTDALLVPSCGVLWGGAAGGFTDTPRDQALKEWEATTGRTATIYHTYHKGDEMFPTKAEIAMTRDAASPRVLLLNWKIAYNTTWAKVAAGAQDKRIDTWSAYVKKNYDQKFFLALHHEPENDIQVAASTGMTAKDYANMYRYVIKRLRANGVDNAVNVVAYMGNEKWMAQSWWQDIYPGDDVVDWIGLDSYVSVEKDYYHYGDMGDLLDRQPSGGGVGWYDWAVRNHPTKPIMVAEWGMYHRTKSIVDKAAAFNTVVPELKAHPAVKAVVYFDTKSDDEGDRDISVNSTPAGLAAFKKIAADPMFNVKLGR
jgi:hypothetical protein